MEFKCKDCIHYCICKDTVADENWTDEALIEIKRMFSPAGCENFAPAYACEECSPDPTPAGGLTGWICPKCGAALSPFVNYCIKCSGNWEITYGTGTAPQTGFCQVEANFNEKQR